MWAAGNESRTLCYLVPMAELDRDGTIVDLGMVLPDGVLCVLGSPLLYLS